ncbi:MAG: glycosyltransferase [Rhodopila sp.]|nr:glycosyltransferase [Rhodopila sp.]
MIDFGVRQRDATRPMLDEMLDYKASRRISAAIFIQDLSPGGVERQSLVLARELQVRGFDIVLVVHQMCGELVPLLPPGVPVVDLHSARTLQDILRLRRFLLDKRPDVFMANVDHKNVAAACAKALAATDTRLVICQHNPLTAEYHATVNWKHRVVPWSYRALSSRIDHAVAVSEGIARELVHDAGLPPNKISTIFNAVIGEDFDDRASEPVHHPWLLDKDRPVFVTAGRLVEMKDQRTLLRAFAVHLRQRPSRLMVLGSGPMLDELRNLADTLGIAEHVAFAGFVRNPLPFMRLADAFVLSSRSEGFGNVLVEAMGCGTPVVSTDCPHGPADILAHGKYGILVPPRDPDALALAFSRVLDERETWPRDLLRARAAAFSYRACADGYARLFNALILKHDCGGLIRSFPELSLFGTDRGKA